MCRVLLLSRLVFITLLICFFLSNNISWLDIPRVELYTCIVYLSFVIFSYLYCILTMLFSPYTNVVCWINNHFFICRFYSGVAESFSCSSKKQKVAIPTLPLHVVRYAFFIPSIYLKSQKSTRFVLLRVLILFPS
jgi:hypothetical protein